LGVVYPVHSDDIQKTFETREDVVSSHVLFVRHHKQQTDRAISAAYARLGTDPRAQSLFAELLRYGRERAPRLMTAPVVDGLHPGVEALANLSRYEPAYIQPLASWPGCDGAWRPAVRGLAQHLVGNYPVPPFLASAWYAAGTADAERKQDWFIAHAAGVSFRSLDLPMVMTRTMEDIFLRSRDHLGIDWAMRRAELLGLGAAPELVESIRATSLATDLRNGDFWRTVWRFLIANAGAIDMAQIGPLIDFVQAIRHERVAVHTPNGIVMRDPPDPSFSMKGRTARSMLRLMQEWHRSLGVAHGGLTWAPSPLRPMVIEEPGPEPSAPPTIWELRELTNSAELQQEGAALRHCVGSYADKCWRGASRIWALRTGRGDKVRHILTIEVDMHARAVVQARGWRNRQASGRPLRLLHAWMTRENLRLR
jgi:PcfJ-like protein